MANTTEAGLGLSPLTEKIYWGRQDPKKRMWTGEKKDVTNNFIDVMFAYLEENVVRTITTDKAAHLFIHVKKDKESIQRTIKHLQKLIK